VSHEAATVSVMEDPSDGFGEGVGAVDDAGNEDQEDVAGSFPFLDGEPLDVDVAGTWSWFVGVGHEDGSLIVAEGGGGAVLFVAELGKMLYPTVSLGAYGTIGGSPIGVEDSST